MSEKKKPADPVLATFALNGHYGAAAAFAQLLGGKGEQKKGKR